MATSSFYTDMIIETPEEIAAFRDLLDGKYVFTPTSDVLLPEATDEEAREFMIGFLRKHGYNDEADEIESDQSKH